MITLKSVSKSYKKSVLKNFSYEFPETGLFIIRGKSGVGKTTLIRLIADLEKPECGEIILNQEKKISVVFQEARLIPFLSLKENILLVKKERDIESAKNILRELSLEDAAEKFPEELSGGMKLRGAIARSLYYGGDIYLWDEPTKELDPENKKRIVEIIHRISKNKLMIVVTHDPELFDGIEICL